MKHVKKQSQILSPYDKIMPEIFFLSYLYSFTLPLLKTRLQLNFWRVYSLKNSILTKDRKSKDSNKSHLVM